VAIVTGATRGLGPVVRVNLSAPFHLARAVLATVEAAGFGRIVTVSSVTAVMGSPVEAVYRSGEGGPVRLRPLVGA
jgi:short-subunit dehydrogenase involved in D-alanine esterification of teichoic acids